ncbi:hypothetical protein [Sphingomonas hylomeconis]|uniref:Uncharacterized protein n=1 Tax=Sphingomonas hylomeconis TaxID=1395958 RepID=A0ABV7STT0_9SPHN|nr:hypothetical protein [Sphingomonas hylomeconis]
MAQSYGRTILGKCVAETGLRRRGPAALTTIPAAAFEPTASGTIDTVGRGNAATDRLDQLQIISGKNE